MIEVIGRRDGRFVISLDRDNGIVIADLTGFWSIEDHAAFVPVIDQAAIASRAQHDHALVLFDATQSQVMSSALAENYQSGDMQYIKPGDRIAIVLLSQLLKMQAKRMVFSDGTRFFDSREKAEQWLAVEAG